MFRDSTPAEANPLSDRAGRLPIGVAVGLVNSVLDRAITARRPIRPLTSPRRTLTRRGSDRAEPSHD